MVAAVQRERSQAGIQLRSPVLAEDNDHDGSRINWIKADAFLRRFYCFHMVAHGELVNKAFLLKGKKVSW